MGVGAGAEGRYLDFDQVAGEEPGGARNKAKLGFFSCWLEKNVEPQEPARLAASHTSLLSGKHQEIAGPALHLPMPPPPASQPLLDALSHTGGGLLTPSHAHSSPCPVCRAAKGEEERSLLGRARDSVVGFHLLKAVLGTAYIHHLFILCLCVLEGI